MNFQLLSADYEFHNFDKVPKIYFVGHILIRVYYL